MACWGLRDLPGLVCHASEAAEAVPEAVPRILDLLVGLQALLLHLLWAAVRLALCQTEACHQISLRASLHCPLEALEALPVARPVDPASLGHHLLRPAVQEGDSEEGLPPSDLMVDADPWGQMVDPWGQMAAQRRPTSATGHGRLPAEELVTGPKPDLTLTGTGRRWEALTKAIPPDSLTDSFLLT